MLKSLVGGALIAASLLPLGNDASAQDLTGTWLKATVSARVLVEDEPKIESTASLAEGFPPPSFDPKPKRAGIKNTFYLRIDELDFNEYRVSVWVDSEQGLVMTSEGDGLEIGPHGIITRFFFDLELAKKTKNGVDELGTIAFSTNGRMKVKLDKQNQVKRVSLTSLGGRAQGFYRVDGVNSEVFGGVRLKAKSIPEDKVPPLAGAGK